MWPLMDVDDLVGAACLPTDGQASPSDITQSLAKGARMHGAKICRGRRASPASRSKDGRIVAVETDRGRHRLREGGELRRPVGARRSAPWPASTCRCSRSSTSTSSPRRSTGWPPTLPTLRDPDRLHLLQGGGRRPGHGRLRAEPDRLDRPATCPDDFAVPAVRRRLGPFRAASWTQAHRPRAGAGDGRHQADDQRAGELHAGRQLHPRRGAGMREHLRRRRLQRLRHRLGRRRRLGAGGMGRDGRGAARPLGRSTSAASPACTATATGCATARSRPMASTTRSASRTRNMTAAGRAIVSPLYERLKAQGAVFGSKLGWERPNWFAPEGMRAAGRLLDGPAELVRRRSATSTGACASAVGLFDQSSFAKFELTRPRRRSGARLDLRQRRRQAAGPADLHADAQRARRHRVRPHRRAARRGPLLHRHRHRLPHPRFRLDRATTSRHGLDAQLIDVTEAFGTLSLMGPRPATCSPRVTAADVSNAGFPFGHVREIAIAGARGAGAARHLCRRARLGAACADRRDRRRLRRADGGRRAARHPPGRLPRARIAAAGKGLPRLGLRHHAQRHAARGRPRLGGEAGKNTPFLGRDALEAQARRSR